MKVSVLVDCTTSLVTDPGNLVLAQNIAAVHLDDNSTKPYFSFLSQGGSDLELASKALTAQLNLAPKDIPPTITPRQLYGWLVCLAISRAFEINVGLTIEVPTGPDPRD